MGSGTSDGVSENTQIDAAQPPSPMVLLVAFGGLSAALAAGYGVLFTIAADYRDEYDISENWIGIIIGIGFIAGFLSQITIAPLADRGRTDDGARRDDPGAGTGTDERVGGRVPDGHPFHHP